MKKPVFFVIIFCAVLVPMFVTQSILKQEKTKNEINQSQKTNISFPQNLEIAKTTQERSIGLMNRDSLCDTCGMLFVFDSSAIQSFWMKNTKIPLDMVFLDETGKVVTIHQKTTPFQESPSYQSTKPAKYVLEVNSGWSQQFSLATGDSFDVSKYSN
jgi:uncharacterized membrane protein (UPF0127 family)